MDLIFYLTFMLQEIVSSSEDISAKTKSVIELKKLQLLELQRRLRRYSIFLCGRLAFFACHILTSMPFFFSHFHFLFPSSDMHVESFINFTKSNYFGSISSHLAFDSISSCLSGSDN